MSRLGDLIKLERTRRGQTVRQVARQCGVTENYLVDVEEGRRIIQDEQARRILKKIGLTQQTEADFSLDDIAVAADLAAGRAKGRPIAADGSPDEKPQPPRPAQPVASLPAIGDEGGGGIFLDALRDVLRQVPVYDAAWRVTGHRFLPVLDGRIEGGAPDKVLYFAAPDASCRGFRILPGDLALIVPAQSPVDGAVMLCEYRGHRALRKVKVTDPSNVLLQSYDQSYEADSVPVADVAFVGRAVRLEIAL